MKLFKRLGIDLGTANSVVYVAGQGIVLNEPTVVAVSEPDRLVLAVGQSAKEMLGRTPGNIIATRPMRDGVIADFRITEAMLRYFIRQVMGRLFIFKPEVMICVPAGCTQVERRAVQDAAIAAGARRVYLIDEPLAAAIGAGLPIGEPGGNMVVDTGGGAAEAAVISLGGVVVHDSARVGGNKLDEAIANYVRRRHNLIIGDQTAEGVKIKIGDALLQQTESKTVKQYNGETVTSKTVNSKPVKQSTDSPAYRLTDYRPTVSPLHSSTGDSLAVKGRDSITGLPRTITLTAAEVADAIKPPLLAIIACIKRVLEKIPPELSADIIDHGIVLTGGTSLLKNFAKLVTKETGVPAYVAEDAILCVAKGTGIALENLEAYKRAITAR